MKENYVSVYKNWPQPLAFLMELLHERPKIANISHKEMPTWKQHVKFVKSRPYKEWFTIVGNCNYKRFYDGNPGSNGYRKLYGKTYDTILGKGEHIGSIYLTKNNEIGIFIQKQYWRNGIAERAIKWMMKRHKNILANINPLNKSSIALFEKMGFRHIQNTYEYKVI